MSRLILAVFAFTVLSTMINVACTGGSDTGVTYGGGDYGADQNLADDRSR